MSLIATAHVVAAERTGWRDQELSERHRRWGFHCPCVDLDFLAVEYHYGLPVALVEYKHKLTTTPDLSLPTYRALKALADGYRTSPLPFIIVTYCDEQWWFKVTPVNDAARNTTAIAPRNP